ncbi:hypothetical protein CWS43_26010 [Rahnella sp. AA]|nr:hypothetical protein CWS43_26010 [Rahnella sp. AA]
MGLENTLVSAFGANAEIRPGFARTTPTAYFGVSLRFAGMVSQGGGWASVEPIKPGRLRRVTGDHELKHHM